WENGDVGDPSVVLIGPSSWVMYYSARGLAQMEIGRATSSDGVHWTRTSDPVLPNGNSGTWDHNGILQPHVLFDGVTFRMWYVGADMTVKEHIGYATSTDGLVWVKSANPVLSPGASGTWDAAGVSAPRVILDGGVYK